VRFNTERRPACHGVTQMSEINWQQAVENSPSINMMLGESELDSTHAITFTSVKQLENGYIVADVTSETIDGDTLWLSGKFGAQNGLMSLLKASNNDIEGKTFNFIKQTSDKSPAGYAFRWTV